MNRHECKDTICKALRLLSHFNSHQREMSLTALAAASGHDKAKVRRYMLSLMECGFIEQCPGTRAYRVGPSVTRLANIRQTPAALRQTVDAALQRLAAITQETVHCSQLCGSQLANIAVVESGHTNRISMPANMTLPLHATSSGIALLAFAERAVVHRALAGELPPFTATSPTTPQQVRQRMAEAQKCGYALSSDLYELGVTSVAMPTFDQDGMAAGAVSIAAPGVRMSLALAQSYVSSLHRATRLITEAQQGQWPASCLVDEGIGDRAA